MNSSDAPSPRVHHDPVFFREAVEFTAARTGFTPRLIEKDYACTVLLACLATTRGSPLVFKGGTCLAKIHAGFYRMSEDLDFVIPVETNCSRSERSRRAAVIKRRLATIGETEPWLRIGQDLHGANQCRQYVGSISYTSVVHNAEDAIKIEVGLREPLMTPPEMGSARTALLDPVSGADLVSRVPARCISKKEAFAEKIRAALTRREVAIRDFYDIDYATTQLGLDPMDPAMIDLIRRKISVPGNEPVNVSGPRMSSLEAQLNTRLRPVLRQKDFQDFDLDHAMTTILQIAESVAER